MSGAPFMQLWVSDFLADTMDLDAREIGAYMLLLMALWSRDGVLPDDQKKLQRIARVGRDWPKVWATLEGYFIASNGTISNRRLSEELQKVCAKREVRQHAGSLGGKAKALKSKGRTIANATVLLKQSEPESDIRDTSTDVDVPVRPFCDTSEAVAEYNAVASRAGWPQVQKMTETRRRAVRARFGECGGIEGWRTVLGKAEASDFLCGKTDRPWSGFGFDWLTAPKNFTKIMEGNYDNRSLDKGISQGRAHRPDPAIEQIARLAGLGAASGNGRL